MILLVRPRNSPFLKKKIKYTIISLIIKQMLSHANLTPLKYSVQIVRNTIIEHNNCELGKRYLHLTAQF